LGSVIIGLLSSVADHLIDFFLGSWLSSFFWGGGLTKFNRKSSSENDKNVWRVLYCKRSQTGDARGLGSKKLMDGVHAFVQSGKVCQVVGTPHLAFLLDWQLLSLKPRLRGRQLEATIIWAF
jgi:hypothetical protein